MIIVVVVVIIIIIIVIVIIITVLICLLRSLRAWNQLWVTYLPWQSRWPRLVGTTVRPRRSPRTDTESCTEGGWAQAWAEVAAYQGLEDAAIVFSYWRLLSEYWNEQITKEYSSGRTPHQSRCMMAFLLEVILWILKRHQSRHQSRCMMAFLLEVILWILKRTNHKGIFEQLNTSSIKVHDGLLIGSYSLNTETTSIKTSIKVHDGLLIGSYSLNTETNKSQRNIRAVEHLINQGAWWPSYWKLFSEYWNDQITKEHSSSRTPHQSRSMMAFLLEVILWILKRTNHKGIFERSNTSSIKVHDGLLIGSYSLNTERNKSQRNIRAVEHSINRVMAWAPFLEARSG